MATRAQRAKCRTILKDICMPFTVGYHVENSPDSGQPITRQDGFIATWVFLTMMLAFAAAITFGRWFTSNWSKSIDRSVIQIIAGTLQAICCALFMPILCIKRIRHKVSKSDYRNNNRQATSCRQWTKKILPIIGITIFLTGIIAMGILNIVAYSDCMSIYSELHDFTYVLREGVVAVVYHPVRILFASIITMLCIMYVRGELRFYRVAYLRYMLTLVLVNLIWIWVDTQLTESLDGHISEFGYSNYKQKLNCTKTNETHGQLSILQHGQLSRRQHNCLCKQTDTFSHVQAASKILYSFVVEYCLLVVECIMHMLFSMEVKTSAGDPDPEEAEDERDPDNHLVEEDRNQNRGLLVRVESLVEEVPFQYHAQNVVSMHNSNSERLSESTRPSYGSIEEVDDPEPGQNSLPSNRLAYFFVGLVLGLAFVVLTAMKSYSILPATNGNSFKVAYFSFKLFYHIVAVIITIQGFRACRGFRSKHRGYMGFEMLTLFTSFGYFLYVFFILQANIAQLRGTKYIKHVETHSYRPANIVYIVDIVVNTIQVYTQTLFMLHSSKIKHPAGRTRAIRDMVYRFKQVILYLATCNFFIWALESFIELQNVSGMFTFHSLYYGEAQWEMISHVAYPLMIFYRFNSCIYLIGIHLST